MISDLRKKVFESMEVYKGLLNPINRGWKCLEVGIAGDPPPSGNYQYFGVGNTWKTIDNVEKFKPDIVADITDTKLPGGEWDLIICSQTLEHIFEFQKAIKEIYRLLKPEGYAILDSPWEYPYHGEEDFDDYWRISDTALVKLAKEVGFKVIEYGMMGPLSTGLFQKP